MEMEIKREAPIFRTELGALKVCAYCYPNYHVFVDYPQLRKLKLQITHGMCQAHFTTMMEAINGGGHKVLISNQT